MFSRNSLELTGNFVKLVKDICNEKGERLVRFSLAYNSVQKGEREPLYLDCVAFGVAAETIINTQVPGREYRCNGELLPNNYVDKYGKKQYKLQYKIKYVEAGSLPKKYQFDQEDGTEINRDEIAPMYIGDTRYVPDDYMVNF